MYFGHVYIKKKIQKNFKISKSFLKKEKNFQKRKKTKGLWTRGIQPLSHFKKKNL